MAVVLERSRLGTGGVDPALAGRLRREIEGEVLFDAFDRGRYAPTPRSTRSSRSAWWCPRTNADVEAALAIAREAGRPGAAAGRRHLPGRPDRRRGAGHRQQPSYLTGCSSWTPRRRTRAGSSPASCSTSSTAMLQAPRAVLPGRRLDRSRATLGGMAANNSCGSRSHPLRHHGRQRARDRRPARRRRAAVRFGRRCRATSPERLRRRATSSWSQRMRALAEREADEIAGAFPKLLRRVGGYNLDRVAPCRPQPGATLLVGSEGTLAFFTAHRAASCSRCRAHRVLGICHFPSFYEAMDADPAIVALRADGGRAGGPHASSSSPATSIVPPHGASDVRARHAGCAAAGRVRRRGRGGDCARACAALDELMADLGFPDGVVEAIEPAFQARIWDVRKAGLNIMMSMKGDGQAGLLHRGLRRAARAPRRLHRGASTRSSPGTAPAAPGTPTPRSAACTSARSSTSRRTTARRRCARSPRRRSPWCASSRARTRASTATAWCARSSTRRCSAAHGRRLRGGEGRASTRTGCSTPAKIVRAAAHGRPQRCCATRPATRPHAARDRRSTGRPGAASSAPSRCATTTAPAASATPASCARRYRATRDETHVTRGRANVAAPGAHRPARAGRARPRRRCTRRMALCVGCKGCKRECPTGVDMARMKIEFLHHCANDATACRCATAWSAYLPRYAPWAARLRAAGSACATACRLLRAARRALARPQRRALAAARGSRRRSATSDGPRPPARPRRGAVRRHLHPLVRAGERCAPRAPCSRPAATAVHRRRRRRASGRSAAGAPFSPPAWSTRRGREAGGRSTRLRPHRRRAGVPIVGLEPSCLLTLRDEFAGAAAAARQRRASPRGALLLEEFLVAEQPRAPRAAAAPDAAARGAAARPLPPEGVRRDGRGRRLLRLVPELEVRADRVQLLRHGRRVRLRGRAPRGLDADGRARPAAGGARRRRRPLIVADGTSCRHQIRDGSAREAVHVARVLERALAMTRSKVRAMSHSGCRAGS